jgi:holo-[acyl-carrier protein] synthase
MIVGLGIDHVDVERFRRLLDRHGSRLRQRIFTPRELALRPKTAGQVQTLAARFAAKEAGMKAIGTGWAEGVTFQDFEIGRDERGAPVLTLHGEALHRCQEMGVTNSLVSLSHTDQMAVAVVILEAQNTRLPG